MFKFKKGLVVGKFYPPHRGHKYLIDTAKAQCDELTVILCWKRSETIPGYLRASWLKKIHPDVHIKVMEDNKLADDDSEGWAKYTLDVLGYVPDAVFTSEDYGDPYAKFLGAVHVLVDKNRTFIPISATIVRRDPLSAAEYLEPVVRAHFARRVVVLGAESTGTTTLSRALAQHYKTSWVPEYGRMYSEGKVFAGKGAEWTSDEFMTIAREQAVMEDALALSSSGLLICDTDPFATSVWHERYMNSMLPELEDFALSRSYDLYIVTGDEIPFVQDGLRDGEHIRHAMHARFMEKLEQNHKHYIVVTGTPEERLKQAVAAIDQVLVQ